ncbi:putative deoxyribonuclease tatdn3 [Syncephalastrum racemosum]|uniref:Putative deoxyribonuclease tatdn3 n=1 Tax=Syncephalastrum racemosum TaxID=13706 RepID=A0A1X2HQR0_SYNRA|nr:putative deoxyribonuclease tatdn3 [Syncephalastrum racemosum]
MDVHAHITTDNFPTRADPPRITLEAILEHAKEAGVRHIVSVTESERDVEPILGLARDTDGFILPAVGLHPVQAVKDGERSVTLDDWTRFEPLLQKAIQERTIVCVGEIGLDFSRHIITGNPCNEDPEDQLRDTQRHVFRRQVQLAIEADLPVNVHSRSAGHHALEILYELNAKRVIMHAFDGKLSYAKKAVEHGFYFSVPPSTVRSPQKQNMVAALPLSHLLLESDAPALGPEKGVDNEPANIMISAQEIARIKQISVEQVIEETTRNAETLFNMK